MKVSIIIPVYNTENYIEKCLESVNNQTYTDIECILVDDCGKDSSIEISKNFINQQKDSLIDYKIISHAHNKGLSGARNTGIQNALGEYIFFLDSDDEIVPECIECLVNLAKKYPDAKFIQGNIVDGDLKLCKYSFNHDVVEYSSEKKELEKIILSELITSACNRLISLSFLKENNLFFKEKIIHEDFHWCYFLAKYCNAAAFTNKTTYIYNTHDGSIMNSVSKEMASKRIRSRMYISKSIIEDILEVGTSSLEQRKYVATNLLSCCKELGNMGSFKEWLIFWKHVFMVIFYNFTKFSCYRALFVLCLLPPCCLIVGTDSVRWRIQKYILPRL